MKKILLATAALIAGGAAIAQTPAPAPVPPTPQVHMKFMSNRAITRNEVVGHIRDLFARLDTNRDGYVSREEMDAAHQKMMGMAGDIHERMAQGMAEHGMLDRNAMFDRLDTNHDGNISRQEFMAAQQMREQRVIIMRSGADAGPMGMRMHGMGGGMGFGGRLFDMADTNHDGRVSLAEAQAAALAHFDRADLNHDGTLTPEERQQAHQMMRNQRKPG